MLDQRKVQVRTLVGAGMRFGFSAKKLLWLVLLTIIAVVSYPIGRYVWASDQYRRAQKAADVRDFAQARLRLERCAREWPKNAEVRFQAAQVARRAGEIDDAQRLLKEAEKLGWVREALNFERMLMSVQLGNYRTVAPLLVKMLREEHSDSLLILEALTPQAMREFELDLAAECVDRWARIEPSNPQPHLWRGQVYERLLQRENALASYRMAVELAPDNVEARTRCAGILLERKLPSEAKIHYDWLHKRLPDDPAVLRGVASCLVELDPGRHDEARQILQKLIDRSPDDAASLALLGQLELNSGRFPEAEKLLERAVKIIPSEVVLLHQLQKAYAQTRKLDKAKEMESRHQRAEQDQKEAKKQMDLIVKNPSDPEPRRQLAKVLLRNGMESEARRWLETALRIDPRHAATYEILAECHRLSGDLKRAEEISKIAKELSQ